MEQQTFFTDDRDLPLAARLRPRTLEEFVGQKHLLGEGKVLRRLIETELSVLDIAAEYGYDNASKFASAFKQVMGISPAEYRRLGFLRAAE